MIDRLDPNMHWPLFRLAFVVALKDATADLARPPRLRALCGHELVQLSGDDATAADYRAAGGHGCISVTANVAPALCARLHHAWDDGDLAGFARLRDLLHPLHEALFVESNPIPLKAALEQIALCSACVRLPLTRATPATRAMLSGVLPRIFAAEQRATLRPPASSAAGQNTGSSSHGLPVAVGGRQ